MPKLVIDRKELEVPEGTKVIEAAQMLGIMIPRFCYHEAMGSIGACRVCAVKFLEGPVKGIQMSCMEDAADGMVVSTTDPEAAEFRKHIIEWLMVNHPHDCPVCDEGGHCLLQDETVSGGHGIRRYRGKKRTYRDQFLGPFVQHEMNRCIHCLRCRRFYQDFAGYDDLGAMRIGNRTYFGRYSDGALESPFAGNLIDVCPTGVFTDKVARFKARRWNLERAPSVCIHCSLGCSTTGSGRYREMIRQEARANMAVNGYFICDRGRFGFDFANHPDRPRQGRLQGKETTIGEAVEKAAGELLRIRKAAGPKAVACLGSARSSLETQAWLKRFCSAGGFADPFYFSDPDTEQKVCGAVRNLDARTAFSMRDIEGSDFILAICADPLNEAPMLALAMRQAQRTAISNVQVIQPINMLDPIRRAQHKGAAVFVIDPRPLFLPLEFQRLAATPERIDHYLYSLVQGRLSELGPQHVKWVSAGRRSSGQKPPESAVGMISALRNSKRPVLICGIDIARPASIELTARLVRLLQKAGKQAGLFYVLPGANAFGAALLSTGSARESLIEAIERGTVKALVAVENDPFHSYPDRQRLETALGKLDLLVVLDYLPSPAVERAHIVLPTTTVFEQTSSAFINQEGRLQSAAPVQRDGIPIEQVSGGSHPPRSYRGDVPGGELRPAAVLLEALAVAMFGPGAFPEREDIWQWLGREHPIFKAAVQPAARLSGMRLLPQERPADGGDLRSKRLPAVIPKHSGIAARMLAALIRRLAKPAPQFVLLPVERTFGTEELSIYSRHTRKAEQEPELLVHPETGGRAGILNGRRVRLALDGGDIDIRIRFTAGMARGIGVLPRQRILGWQKIRKQPAFFSIRPVGRESRP